LGNIELKLQKNKFLAFVKVTIPPKLENPTYFLATNKISSTTEGLVEI